MQGLLKEDYVVELDNINRYYDVNPKYALLKELRKVTEKNMNADATK